MSSQKKDTKIKLKLVQAVIWKVVTNKSIFFCHQLSILTNNIHPSIHFQQQVRALISPVKGAEQSVSGGGASVIINWIIFYKGNSRET